MTTLLPIGVYAVQNIFTDFGQITDIQYGGKNIDKVVYQGEVIWERTPSANFIQEITTANCPTTRTMAVDARDNATYWVQKLADGRCWMLTNLAYGGGGTNTYNDVKAITNVETSSYTEPYYMIPPNSNKTVSPQEPSASTDGGATNPQYGYLYNWCAAMGGQTGTVSCMPTNTSPLPDASISICPGGWRLPTGGSNVINSEFEVLNNAINGGSITSPAGIFSNWLGMLKNGSQSTYWSSSLPPFSIDRGGLFIIRPAQVGYGAGVKDTYREVRCIAM